VKERHEADAKHHPNNPAQMPCLFLTSHKRSD
jgi:hypothetical protein